VRVYVPITKEHFEHHVFGVLVPFSDEVPGHPLQILIDNMPFLLTLATMCILLIILVALIGILSDPDHIFSSSDESYVAI